MQDNSPFLPGSRGRRVLWACAAGWSNLVAFMPIFVILAHYFARLGSQALWLWSLSIAVLVGVLLASIAKPRLGSVDVVAGSALVAYGVAYVLHGAHAWLGLLLLAIATFAVSLVSAQHWRADRGMTQVTVYFAGALVHFISLFIFHQVAGLTQWSWLITVSGLGVFFLLCFALVQARLDALVLARDVATGLPKPMVRYSRWLALAFAAVICLLFAIRALQRLAARLWWAMVHGVLAAIGWLGRLFPKGKQHPAPHARRSPFASGHQPAPPQHVAPGLLSQIIVLVFLAVLLGALAWVIWKRVLPALRALYRTWLDVQDGTDAGYQDEVEFIKSDRTNGPLRQRRRSKTPLERWDELTTTQARVRYLYRRLLANQARSGYVPRHSLTATETTRDIVAWQGSEQAPGDALLRGSTADQLARLYDEARYGQTVISTEEVVRLKTELELQSPP